MAEAKKNLKTVWIIVSIAVALLIAATVTYYIYFLAPTVRGSIDYDGDFVLPEGSKLVIQLRDTSYQDAASELIAETVIVDPGQSPVSFKLDYDRGDIAENNTYSLQVSIYDNDQRLLFVNDTAYDVITRGNPRRVDIPLINVQTRP